MALTDGVRDNTAVVAQQVLAATVFERQYNFARFPTFDAFPAEATDVSEFLAGSRHIVPGCLTFAVGGREASTASLRSAARIVRRRPAEARKSD